MKKKYIVPNMKCSKFERESIVIASGNPEVLSEKMKDAGYAVTIQRIKNLTL